MYRLYNTVDEAPSPVREGESSSPMNSSVLRSRSFRLLFLSLGCLAIFLEGCAGTISPSNANSGPNTNSGTITISPQSVGVQAGAGTQPFTATLQNDTQNKGVTWTVSGAGCSGATCGTLSNVTAASVTYTAPANQPKPNTVILTATPVTDTTRSSSATITVV